MRLLNSSNIKWFFLPRWKLLAGAVNSERKCQGAMVFDKNVTSYCRELRSPTVLPARGLFPALGAGARSPRHRNAGEIPHCPGRESETLEGGLLLN